MFKHLLVFILIAQILSTQVDCDYCKGELLDSLRVKTESVIVKCLDSDFQKNPVGTVFGNCLFTFGVDSAKVKRLVGCVTSNCWDQWVNKNHEQILF